jgi:cell division transport system permease protein
MTDSDLAQSRSGSPNSRTLVPTASASIVPQDSVGGRALVAVVAIMTFLASLTTGAVMLVRASAVEWQSDVAREVTIQLRPAPGREIEADLARAAEIARGFPGIAEVRP